jgi:hypothetical protein
MPVRMLGAQKGRLEPRVPSGVARVARVYPCAASPLP